jgi:two-component system cell cycle response regulator
MSNNVKKTSIVDKFPSPSGATLRVMQMVNNPETTLDQIVQVIQTDPALISQMLKTVNSAAVGGGRAGKNVGSISTAVRLLGMQTTRSIALAFSLTASHRKGTCEGFDYERFWSQSVARACAARFFAHRHKDDSPDEAFTCGLLCQLGRLAFASVFPEIYGTCSFIRQGTDELLQWERENFGLDHNQLAADMMSDWGLPQEQIEAVRHQDDLQNPALLASPPAAVLSTLLHLGGQTSEILHGSHYGRVEGIQLPQSATLTLVRAEEVPAIIDRIATEWIEAGKLFSIKTCSEGRAGKEEALELAH